jgi:antitoxin (DNA-binding transcriptional repressor) of toxin-antitoxin stability system
MTPISMIDVAQHFAKYVDLVVTRGERFTVLREGKPVAELGPVLQVVRLEDLPALLASLPCLTPAAADAIAGDWDVGGAQDDVIQDPLAVMTCTGESNE